MALAPLPRRCALVGALAFVALAAACATEGEFPSLEPRAMEGEDPLAEPVRTRPAVAGEPALRARAAELVAEARRGDREFAAAFGRASASVRSAGVAGSESWVQAQQAVSRAEAARAPATGALAELDRLVAERAREPTNEEDFAAIRRALAEVEALAAAQQQRMDELRAGLRR